MGWCLLNFNIKLEAVWLLSPLAGAVAEVSHCTGCKVHGNTVTWIQLYLWSCSFSLYHKFPDEPDMDGENKDAAGKEVSEWLLGGMDAPGASGKLNHCGFAQGSLIDLTQFSPDSQFHLSSHVSVCSDWRFMFCVSYFSLMHRNYWEGCGSCFECWIRFSLWLHCKSLVWHSIIFLSAAYRVL